VYETRRRSAVIYMDYIYTGFLRIKLVVGFKATLVTWLDTYLLIKELILITEDKELNYPLIS
jgi:hypothetical protein